MKMRHLIFLSLFTFTSQSSELVSLKQNCQSGVYPIEHTQLSLHIACEGALGNYLGIMLTGHWSKLEQGKWKIDSRYWFDKTWGNDVISYYYEPKSKMLYISTSGIYGSAGVYILNIHEQEFTPYESNIPTQVDLEEGYYEFTNVTEQFLNITYTVSSTSHHDKVFFNRK